MIWNQIMGSSLQTLLVGSFSVPGSNVKQVQHTGNAGSGFGRTPGQQRRRRAEELFLRSPSFLFSDQMDAREAWTQTWKRTGAEEPGKQGLTHPKLCASTKNTEHSSSCCNPTCKSPAVPSIRSSGVTARSVTTDESAMEKQSMMQTSTDSKSAVLREAATRNHFGILGCRP